MIPPLDIFKRQNDGTLLWKGTAENLEIAKLSVRVLANTSPGHYLVVHQGTGEQILIMLENREQTRSGMTLPDTAIPACPKHETYMVPNTDSLAANSPQGTVSFRCPNLDCTIVYVTGAFEGFYTLETSGKLKPV
jgi:hypothetical protein